MKESDFVNQLIREAGRFVGLVEIKPNASWDNPKTAAIEKALSDELVSNMKNVPWQPGWAYCIAFVEAMVRITFRRLGQDAAADVAGALMSAGVLDTFNRLKRAGVIVPAPVRGAIWLARHGNTEQGHAGLVIEPNSLTMATIEANTSRGTAAAAKEREGDGIFPRIRSVQKNGQLVTLGFCDPARLLAAVIKR